MNGARPGAGGARSASRLVAALALAAAAWTGGCAPAPALHGTALTGAAPPLRGRTGDGAFSLADQRGRAVALFFGYTHCPDVCPTILATLAAATARLTPAQRARVRGVFVSVDPARDSGAAADAYAKLFGSRMIGVAVAPAELPAVERAYRVWAQRLPGGGGAYRVAHSSGVYLIDPQGRLRELLDWNAPPAAIAEDLRALL